MATRYREMIQWGIQQFVFCILVVGIYYIASKHIKKMKVTFGEHGLCNAWFQDILLVLILVGITSIRCNSGSDYYNYFSQYQNIRIMYSSVKDVLSARFQNGYSLLCYLCDKYIGGTYTIFFVVSLLLYIPLVKIIRKRSEYPVESVACWLLLGYYSMTTNILKQAFSMIIVTYAFDALYEKKYLRAVIYSVLACFFHLTALYVIISMVISRKIRLNKNLFLLMTSLGMLAMVFLNPILNILFRIVPVRYYVYINNFLTQDINDIKLQLGGLLVSIVYIFLMWYITTKKDVGRNQYYEQLITIVAFSIPILIIGIRYYLLNRIAYFGLQFIILCLPSFAHERYATSNKTGRLKMTYWGGLVVFSILFAILCAENNYYSYTTIFNDIPMSVWDFVTQ